MCGKRGEIVQQKICQFKKLERNVSIREDMTQLQNWSIGNFEKG